MQPRRTTSANPDAFLVPKEGAFIAGMSLNWLYGRLRGPNPPPHKRCGTRYLLPREAFMSWAERDVID